MTELWRARALIDLQALRHNLGVARACAAEAEAEAQVEMYAVVKADAYGHGIENIIAVAAGLVDGFAVATIDEAMRCRNALPKTYAALPIMVLSEFNSPQQIPVFMQHALTIVIHSIEQAQWLGEFADNQTDSSVRAPVKYWLKVDTGMNRLGINTEQLQSARALLDNRWCLKCAGLMSHLASADDCADTQTNAQLLLFDTLLKTTDNLPASIANSAGLVSWRASRYQLVRPGLLLYGITLDGQNSAAGRQVKPVMRLQSRLIAVKQVRKGMRVGYGGSWRAPQDGFIGIVGFGYADGYPRSASNRGYVMIAGQRAPIVGTVSMDMLTVLLGATTTAGTGDIVDLWGLAPTVAEVAKWADTIPYELLCRVSQRVPRQTSGWRASFTALVV